MSSSRARRLARLSVFAIALVLLAACGGDEKDGARPATANGSLVLVIDFEHNRFDLVQGSVPLWSLPFFNDDSADVGSWLESFGGSADKTVPLAENILLRSKNLLTDSVIAIVAEASGFDAHLLQRQIPARFILRWGDAALEVESGVSNQGGGIREYWQSARSTARRLFGEAQMTLVVDSMGALTLQRAAVPPMATRVRPPRKR